MFEDDESMPEEVSEMDESECWEEGFTVNDDPYALQFNFPTSCIRHDPIPTRPQSPQILPTLPSPAPLHPEPYATKLSPAPPPPNATHATTPTRILYPQPIYEIAPGYLSDGTYTSNLPSVQFWLKEYSSLSITTTSSGKTRMKKIKTPESAIVYALVALELYYKPLHPAHWVFWCKARRELTAETILKIMDNPSTPITPPIAFTSKDKSIWLLRNYQYTFRDQLKGLVWFKAKKYEEQWDHMKPRQGRVLRSRKAKKGKVAVGGGVVVGEGECEEGSEVRPLSGRKRKAATTPPPPPSEATLPDEEVEDERPSKKPRTKRSVAGSIQGRGDGSITTKKAKSELIILSSSSALSPPPLPRMSARQQERKSKGMIASTSTSASLSLDPTLSTESNSNPTSTSLHIPCDRGASSVSGSSSSTAVNEARARSTSTGVSDTTTSSNDSSIVTAVEVGGRRVNEKREVDVEAGLGAGEEPLTTRTSTRLRRTPKSKSLYDDLDVKPSPPPSSLKNATPRSRKPTSPPYPNDKEAQVAAGRGKGKAMSKGGEVVIIPKAITSSYAGGEVPAKRKVGRPRKHRPAGVKA